MTTTPDPIAAAMQSAVAALRPLADAVFNDNGDMTVILPVVSSEECISAYFARAALTAALSALVEDQPVMSGTVEYRWDGIAGKMRYFGSAAPNGWLGDKQPTSDTLAPAPAGEDVTDEMVEAACFAFGDVTNSGEADTAYLGEIKLSTPMRAAIEAALSRKGSDAQTVGGGMAIKQLCWKAEGKDFKAISATGEYLLMNEGGRWTVFRNFQGTSAHKNEAEAKEAAQAYHASLVRSEIIDDASGGMATSTLRHHRETQWGMAAPTTTHRDPLPSDADDMGDGAGGVAKGGDR